MLTGRSQTPSVQGDPRLPTTFYNRPTILEKKLSKAVSGHRLDPVRGAGGPTAQEGHKAHLVWALELTGSHRTLSALFFDLFFIFLLKRFPSVKVSICHWLWG